MFVEPNIGTPTTGKAGWIEVICGSMFSGKTEELIRRLNRALIAQQKVEIYKPRVDKRYSKEKVVSHNQNAIESIPVNFANDILLRAGHCDVVGVDEAQFFDPEIIHVCNQLAIQGKRVIVAGLDMDFMGVPFEPMDKLMATAEYITKVHAICMDCGNIASYSYRRTKSKKTVVLGEKDIYEALCRKCFYEKMHRNK
ncbi:thymidine kinase [Marinoscillum furvescens]|uniref:Thymidine kinase n=1 Tax=Marinoscillum furvescens DSM 4134 TaxID=1122208 RepID=A0A3D9L732_MARFU|nr:thymidine kinase [Marinoscillum furvescens]REE01691.1 thymidine kinase [Marinoscillum furvescens DSM 4134]